MKPVTQTAHKNTLLLAPDKEAEYWAQLAKNTVPVGRAVFVLLTYGLHRHNVLAEGLAGAGM
jgi:hypothetical protein